MRSIVFTRSAIKSMSKLSLTTRADLMAKLVRYAETGAGDVRKLIGEPGVRLRSGDYRVIFQETDDEITVFAAGNRRDIYR